MSDTATLVRPAARRQPKTLGRRKRPNIVGKLGLRLGEAPLENEKDVLTPVLVRLSERHLAKARDENKLDVVFRSALARHPEIPNSLIEKFVQDFAHVPNQAKDAHFRMSVLAGSAGAPIDIAQVANIGSSTFQVDWKRSPRGAAMR